MSVLHIKKEEYVSVYYFIIATIHTNIHFIFYIHFFIHSFSVWVSPVSQEHLQQFPVSQEHLQQLPGLSGTFATVPDLSGTFATVPGLSGTSATVPGLSGVRNVCDSSRSLRNVLKRKNMYFELFPQNHVLKHSESIDMQYAYRKKILYCTVLYCTVLYFGLQSSICLHLEVFLILKLHN